MDRTRIGKAFFYGLVFLSMAACGTQQGHMDGNGMMNGNGAIGMGYWNWLLILIVLGIGLLIGFLLAKRKR